MANNGNSAQQQEIAELRKQVEWLDTERRKATRKATELEQRLSLQEREISGREQRIQTLERQLSTFNAQLSRIPQVDTQLSQFKDEIVQMIEQYDQRRIQAEEEADRLRRVEHEATVRELADVRKELPTIGRLQQEMELRQAEEARLANLIGQQQNKISALENQTENWSSSITFLEEKERQNSRNVAEVQNTVHEINKRWGAMNDRLDIINSKLSRINNNNQALTEAQEELRANMKSWLEQIQIGEYERNQRLEKWRAVLDEQSDIIKRFQKEWVTFTDQYKEAKMAVQTLTGWQKQIEQQQQEMSELLRVETHRMQSRWDDHRQEIDKQWKNFLVDTEQRRATVDRRHKQIQEQLQELSDILNKLEQEKDTLWRVQSAQADTVKRLSRIWMEEVEKAINQNPNRRRQPALVPVREE